VHGQAVEDAAEARRSLVDLATLPNGQDDVVLVSMETYRATVGEPNPESASARLGGM
jgi:hypothetical protein